MIFDCSKPQEFPINTHAEALFIQSQVDLMNQLHFLRNNFKTFCIFWLINFQTFFIDYYSAADR